ncbi:MAG TPA: hypothetical protein VFD58_36435 [Blastocatellia bacterium]|nr:hypothetical protein [Blastocatellia bacterium]
MNYYQISFEERCGLLASVGFVRDENRIWGHPDGRAIGESVVAAITDESLLRYLGIEVVDTEMAEGKAKAV